jgi:hypothetical protein
VSILRDFVGFLRTHRKYWLVPIVLVMLLVGLLVAVSVVSPLGPFIYPLF